MSGAARLLALASATALALNAGPASAGVGFEMYSGPRPAEADAPIAKLTKELSLLGDKFGVEARKSLHYVRLPAILDPTLTPSVIAEQFVLGKKRWGRGACDQANELLRVGKYYAQENPALTIQIDNLDELRFDGFIYLALCQTALKNTVGARQTLEESYRTYPDFTTTLAKHTTDGEHMWNDVRKAQAKTPRGGLHVFVDNRKVKLYVNEVARGSDGEYSGEHLPGTYRVLAVEGDKAYRFDVEIESGAKRIVNITWNVQPSLTLSEVWFGFSPPRLTEALERSFRAAVNAMFAGSEDTIYAVGVIQQDAHWYLTGKVYDQHGARFARGGRIELGTNDDARIRAFAKFLHDGTKTRDILSLANSRDVTPALHVHSSAQTTVGPDLAFTWTTAGVAAVLLAAGGWALYQDGKPNCLLSDVCGQPYESATIGYIGLGAGAATAAVSVYSYFSERNRVRSASTTGAAIVPTRGGAMASFGWEF